MHDGDVLPVVRIEPQYPREALVKGIEGWVRVEFVILEDGGVQSVEVLAAEPPGMFERNAVRAVMRWKFKPRIENGVAVRRRGAQTIEFQLIEDP
jgi:protein TonB